MPKQYPRDLRDRTVRLVCQHRADYGTEWEAIGSGETLREWVRKAEIDTVAAPAPTVGERRAVTSERDSESHVGFHRRLVRGHEQAHTLVLDALDTALWRRDRDGRNVQPGLIHHSDAG